jgi:DNA topoisomerase-1
MAENIVIVESPAKAGTIEKYLGSNYKVIASMGHIRDLPSSKMGVEVENGFAPNYVIPTKARKTVGQLKEALKGKKVVYLATDLDREGEAIAWHIMKALDLENNPGLVVHRITFDEITKPAILHAIANPRELNYELIDAQQARRVLDRLVGYTLSPILWKKLYKGLSAGRVQSAALRLVVDREREREAFKPVEYWSLMAFLTAAKEQFSANLVEYKGKKIEQLTLQNEKEVQDIVKSLEKELYAIEKVEKKQVKRRPSAPYTTSTLQQDAVNKLSMSAKSVMRAAQKLYEAGHITYMRTDSVDLAEVAVEALRTHIQGDFGADYLPEKPNKYQTKNKQAQEAHEAIRPTNPTLEAGAIKMEPTIQKVYDLIRRRTIASQMKEAELEQTAATIKAGEATFRANGQRVVFPGFYAIWRPDQDENLLPVLTAGQTLDLVELKSEQHFTEPPPRFTEASLIKTLEELGIGRPSTYAPTIGTLVERGYVQTEQRRLAPEEIGKLVTDLLKEHFPEIVDFSFTASMEEELDKVADGQAKYQSLLENFWGPFNKQVLENSDKIVKVNMTEETDIPCPNCGKLFMIKTGRFGKFLACSGFPECKTTQPLVAKAATGLTCPVCDKPLIERRARRGMFFGCSGYPECTFAVWKKEQLPSKIEELEKEGKEVKYKESALAAFNDTAHVDQTA